MELGRKSVDNDIPNFEFDELKDVGQNLESFFSHLEVIDEEFGRHLRTQLPVAVDDNFDREPFNETVAEMLDDDTGSSGAAQ